MSPGQLLARLLLPILLVFYPISLAQTQTVNAEVKTESEPEVFTPSEKPKTKRVRFELSINLTDPTELKVKEGDRITKGQILSEKSVSQRQLLQKVKLQSQLSEPKSFLEEDQLRAAIAQVEAGKSLLANFDNSSPFKPGTDEAFIPISRTLERNRIEATIKEAAAVAEAIKVRVSERRRQAIAEQNELIAQLKVVDSELEKLKVKSPYSGLIRRIKIERGINNELTAILKIQSDEKNN